MSRTTPRRRHAPGAALLALALLTVAGCGGDDPADAGPTPSPAAPTTSAPGSAPATGTPGATGTAGATPGGSPTPTAAELPADCADLVPTTAVVDAVARPLPGGVQYLTTGPVEASGRTGRVTCSYGVPADGGEPAVEVSLIGYPDAETAAGRIQLSVTNAQAEGDTVTPQPVGDRSGYVLQGADGAALVVADGVRTLVVSLAPGVVRGPATQAALGAIASAVLDRPTEQG